MIHRLLFLAQSRTEAFRTTEFELPESTAGILLWSIGLLVLFGLTVRTSLRDSRFLPTRWRTGLLLLRCTVLLFVLLILLNPRQRTQTTRIQQSRVGILIDTSSSMAYDVTEAADIAAPSESEGSAAEPVESRTDAVRRLLLDEALLKQLSQIHSVSVYSFDRVLQGPQAVVSDGQIAFGADAATADGLQTAAENSPPGAARMDLSESTSDINEAARWDQILAPDGGETRLGESLHQLIGQMAGRTLSGIVVLTDGRSNAGLDVEVARLRAERSDTRLITVGLGSTRPQVNLWLAGMQSPTDVHRGDPFDVSVVVQGSGLQQQPGIVTLFQQSAGSDGSDRRQVAEQSFEVAGEGLPTEIEFEQQINIPGRYEYVAVAKMSDDTVVELTLDDNERRREVEITDRKQRVLLISSGPMRDYRFVRNMLFRHSGIESDVWLQTVNPDDLGFVSQEAREVLTEFPRTEAELFEYDVIVAFDADWSRLSSDQQQYLNRWVDEHSGGIIFVAGELFTPEVARDPEKLRDVAVLYPVIPNRLLSELRVTQRADQPWPVELTPEGRTREFLRIADASGQSSVDLWEQFEGIYRSYPVRSVRDGAVVLAEYGNPRARTQDGQPPFLATQFYGKGRTMFVSSAETWRLRAISPEGHQRFWTGMIRDVGQGRRSRGRSRGLLLVDGTEVSPGQTVTIRAQLYNARLQPLQRESVPLSIVDNNGVPISVPSELRADQKPGQYVTTFRPARPGTYRITLPIPESSDQLQESIEVSLPNLESQKPSQNVELLTSLTQNTAGSYLTLADVQERLPGLLPDRSEPVVIDEQLETLWDRRWLMFLMIALLGAEWALRRVVRLS